MAEAVGDVTPYPGDDRLEEFLETHADQFGYPEARLVFGSRPGDRTLYHPAIAAILEKRRAAGMVATINLVDGGPAVAPAPGESPRLRTPLEAILARADEVFKSNARKVVLGTTPLPLRPGDLARKFEGQDGTPQTLRRLLEARARTALVAARVKGGDSQGNLGRIFRLEGGEQPEYMPLEYGKLPLPEFPETQGHLRILRLELKQLLADLAQSGALERIRESKGSFALQAIEDAVDEHVLARVAALGIEDPTLLEHAANAVRLKQWEGVSEGSPEKFVLTELIAKANRLKFKFIQDWLETSPETGLTRVAELEYQHVMPLMAATDRWFLKLYAENPPIDSDERARRDLKNECAVVREVGGEVVEVPFHEAYPEEVGALVKGYQGLVRSLIVLRMELNSGEQTEETQGILDLIERKIRYYDAVAKAYETSNFDDWMTAETYMAGQIRNGRDAFHVHGIEIAYMRDRIIRSPETSLRIPDDNEPEAQRLSAETKERMLASFRSARFADCPGIAETVHLLEGSNATVRHFLGSGAEMHFKPAGQILPNEPEPRIGGVDSSLDVGSARQRAAVREKFARKVFGNEQWDSLFAPRVNIDKKVGRITAAHELGHALGITATTRERLNVATLANPFIEEWKATVGGLLGEFYVPFLEAQRVHGEESPEAEAEYENVVDWMVDKLGEVCRYAGGRNSDFIKGYLRKSMMMMKVAEEVGILEYDESEGEYPWRVHFDRERILAFCERLMTQYKQVIHIYREGSEENLHGYLGQNLQVTPFTQFLCERIPDGSGIPANTPEGLVELPAAA